MAAARNLPPLGEDVPNPQIITITNNIPSPATCIIANGQGVTFTNASTTVPVSIYFEADAKGVTVFTPNPVLVGASSSTTVYPQTQDRTVNFGVNDTQNTPYAIQVGAGPLYISVSLNAGVVNVTPSPATIPAGGTWEVFKAAIDANIYKVTWPNVAAPPFPDFTVNNTPQTANAVAGNFDYKVKLGPGPAAKTGNGGGTIKVGN